MKGDYLRFVVHEGGQLHGLPAYEWLLEHSKRGGIRGGLAMCAIAGYGRHGVLVDAHGRIETVMAMIVISGDREGTTTMADRARSRIFLNGNAPQAESGVADIVPPKGVSLSTTMRTGGYIGLRRGDLHSYRSGR